MANPLYNKFGGGYSQPMNNMNNILNQFRQIRNDPGKILDILYQNGKINQQQYNELQPIRNNPQKIVEYLSRNGNSGEINQISQMFK